MLLWGFTPFPTKAVVASKKNCFLPDACGAAVLSRHGGIRPKTSRPLGFSPSFLEVPSEVPGEEVLVQIKVTQIAAAAPNVVGDLQEAGRGCPAGAVNLHCSRLGRECTATTKSISLACCGVCALGGWARSGKETVVKHQE